MRMMLIAAEMARVYAAHAQNPNGEAVLDPNPCTYLLTPLQYQILHSAIFLFLEFTLPDVPLSLHSPSA